MSEVPENLKYTAEHEWLQRLDDGDYRMGITDYAQHELSDIVYVELPEVGATFAVGDTMAVAESVKAASDIFAPIAGEIVAVNEKLEESPELVNESPYQLGWMVVLRPAGELPALLDAAAYRAQLG